MNLCTAAGCQRKLRAKGYCGMHYQRVRNGTPMDAPLQVRGYRPCLVDGCDGRVVARNGLCRNHWRAKRLYQSEDGTFRTHVLCACGARAIQVPPHLKVGNAGAQMCFAHVVASLREACFNGLIDGSLNKTGRGSGYRFLMVAGRRFHVHRLVMEHKLGRALDPHESVHHLNGLRGDNRPENLELWATTQPKGQRVADLVAWALEVLERYGDEPLAVGDGEGVTPWPI